LIVPECGAPGCGVYVAPVGLWAIPLGEISNWSRRTGDDILRSPGGSLHRPSSSSDATIQLSGAVLRRAVPRWRAKLGLRADQLTVQSSGLTTPKAVRSSCKRIALAMSRQSRMKPHGVTPGRLFCISTAPRIPIARRQPEHCELTSYRRGLGA
jgi:hypothetical protein